MTDYQMTDTDARASLTDVAREAQPDPGGEAPTEADWSAFRSAGDEWARQGSGMTREQITGATMYHVWLRERGRFAAPPPAGIDVERLAEALEAEAASGRWDGEDGPMRWSSLTLAALIAAEYERLSDDAIEAEARADAAREAQPDVPEGHVCSLPINHTGPHRTRAEAQPLDWDEAVAVARALAAPDPDP